MSAAFAFACVAGLALLLWLERRTQNPSSAAGTGPSPVSPPTAGEDTTRHHDPHVRYWLTDKGYAALADYEQERTS